MKGQYKRQAPCVSVWIISGAAGSSTGNVGTTACNIKEATGGAAAVAAVVVSAEVPSQNWNRGEKSVFVVVIDNVSELCTVTSIGVRILTVANRQDLLHTRVPGGSATM